jgi:predicted AAA+ superfamily ATPase
VSASIRDETTRQRETRALDAAMRELGIEEATIVTMNDAESIQTDAGTIRVIPAWRWLIEGPDR